MALSFQFFNKTRKNILANPHATVLVLDPAVAAMYRLNSATCAPRPKGRASKA